MKPYRVFFIIPILALLLLSGCGAVTEDAAVVPDEASPAADSSPSPVTGSVTPDVFSPEDWYRTSALKRTVDGQIAKPNYDRCAGGSPAKPYIIVRGNGIADDYELIGYSENITSEEDLDGIRTVVICKNVFYSAFYRKTGSTDSQIGGSQGINVCCLDAKTGFYYCLTHFEPVIDVIEPEDLPEKALNVPHYVISDSEAVSFVTERFPLWQAADFESPSDSDVIGVTTDESGISYDLYESYAAVSAYTGDPGKDIVIPAEIEGRPVCAVNEDAFRESSVSGVTFLCSSVEINEDAFEMCSLLGTVSFRGVKVIICKGAFGRCENLSSVDFGGAYVSLEAGSFEACPSLEKLYGMKNLSSSALPGDVFDNWCPLLTENTVTDENGFEYIVFDDCAAVISFFGDTDRIEIPAECSGLPVTSVWCRLIAGSKTTSVVIPEKITCLCDSALAYSSSVKEIIINGPLSVIGKDMFNGDSAVTNIVLPDSVTQIGHSAFSGCSSLAELNLPLGLRAIESYAFDDCTSLKFLTVPASVTYAGRGIFENWTADQTVSVSENTDISAWDEGFLNSSEAVIRSY